MAFLWRLAAAASIVAGPAHGPTTVKTGTINTATKFDCFYLYPTVSTQTTPNSNLVVQANGVRSC